MTATAGDSFEDFQDRKRFMNLDGLRFLCITAVIWHHAGFREEEMPALFSRGFLGVDFFFVLSGFLITTLLLRERRRKGRFSFRGFYWRRFLRIIPVYFFVVTAASLYFGVIKGDAESLQRMPFYYLFLANFLDQHTLLLQPTWSLSVEEQYYVFWPLALALVPPRWIVPFVVGAVALNLAIITGLFDWVSEEPWRRGMFTLKLPNATYAPILLGSLAAILLDRRGVYGLLAQWLGRPWMPVVLATLLLAEFQLLPADLRGWPNLLVHLTMTAFVISIVVRERNVMTGVLNLPPVVRIGEISYGIYLYHLIGLHVVTEVLTPAGLFNPWTAFIGMYVASIIIAEISFRTLEAFFRRFRSHHPFFIAPSTRVSA